MTFSQYLQTIKQLSLQELAVLLLVGLSVLLRLWQLQIRRKQNEEKAREFLENEGIKHINEDEELHAQQAKAKIDPPKELDTPKEDNLTL